MPLLLQQGIKSKAQLETELRQGLKMKTQAKAQRDEFDREKELLDRRVAEMEEALKKHRAESTVDI